MTTFVETWDKTCADCNWDAVCTHKKVLWDGQEYRYVTACCRAMNGRTYIPPILPPEPQDWYLWRTIRGQTIYGRAQFIQDTGTDLDGAMDNPRTPSPRTHKVLSRPMAIPQRDPVARPLVGLKSVYQNEPDNSQGSLF